MRIVRSTEARRTATPAAVMTTFASPTLGGAAGPIWRVDAAPGAAGPVHVIDAEQVWTVLEGTASVAVDGEAADLGPGDTLIVPGGAERRFVPGDGGFSAVVTGPAGQRAHLPGGAAAKATPPWIA